MEEVLISYMCPLFVKKGDNLNDRFAEDVKKAINCAQIVMLLLQVASQYENIKHAE